jgi:DeoR family transcriptional regulator of aga operon
MTEATSLPAGDGSVRIPADRRRQIADLIVNAGSVSVSALERDFGISANTARRDLRALEEEGLALRTYGGAVAPSAAKTQGSFEQRMSDDVEAKTLLGRGIVDFVSDGETIFVCSATASFFAFRSLLSAQLNLTVVTNSLPVMELAAKSPSVDLIALGGSYRAMNSCFAGPATVREARGVLVDKAILCYRGLTSDGELSDVDPLDAEVKAVFRDQATTSILLVTGRTLERRGLTISGTLDDISVVLAADISDVHALQLVSQSRQLVRIPAGSLETDSAAAAE